MAVRHIGGHLLKETTCGEFRSRLFFLDNGDVIEDGDGVQHSVPVGCYLVVIDPTRNGHWLRDKLAFNSLDAMATSWGALPMMDEVHRSFDIRTPEAGGNEDQLELPF